jgi:hypothetical protein
MALKMVEAHVPTELAAEAQETLAELTSQTWTETGGRFGSVIRAVMGTSQTGSRRVAGCSYSSSPWTPFSRALLPPLLGRSTIAQRSTVRPL